MAAASVKLLAGTITLLLLPAGQNVNVNRPRRKVLNHDRLGRAVVLVGSIDAPRVPVGPVDELVKHGHGKGINGGAYDDFPIGPRKTGSLDLLPNGRANMIGRRGRGSVYNSGYFFSYLTSWHLPSRAFLLHSPR